METRRSWILSCGLIILLCCLNYGLRLNKLGLYEMDWFFYNLYTQDGAVAVLRYQAIDRLLAGLPLVVPFFLFGTNIWLWHASIVLMHAGTALLFYGILRRLLPNQTLYCTLAATLFVVYPAVESLFYFSQALSSSSVFFTALSFFLMTLAIRANRVR